MCLRCPSGFTTTIDGKKCIDLDECENNPCLNDGICLNHLDGKGFECHCPAQFAGPYCNALRVGKELNLSNAAVIMIIICVVNILSTFWAQHFRDKIELDSNVPDLTHANYFAVNLLLSPFIELMFPN